MPHFPKLSCSNFILRSFHDGARAPIKKLATPTVYATETDLRTNVYSFLNYVCLKSQFILEFIQI